MNAKYGMDINLEELIAEVEMKCQSEDEEDEEEVLGSDKVPNEHR